MAKPCKGCGKTKYQSKPGQKYCSKECKTSPKAYLNRAAAKIERVSHWTKEQIDDANFYLRPEWLRLRYWAFQRFGRICLCCGDKPPGVIIEVDHIISRRLRPDLELSKENVQVLCKRCNKGKSWDWKSDFRPRPVT